MSDDEREPSEQLRQRVAELYAPSRAREAQLGAEVQRRVIQAATAEAQRLHLARARTRQRFAVASALLLSAAAACWLIVWPREQTARREAAAAPACGLPLIHSAAEFEALEGGQRRLLLGSFGTLLASDSAHITLEHSQACELALRLERGVLAGDLHSLRPARLTIRTPQGEVVVTGTRFSVQTGAEELEVLLASGVIDVVFTDRSSLRMLPGTRLRKPAALGQQATHVPLAAAENARLSAWLSEATALATEPGMPSPRPAASALGQLHAKPIQASAAESGAAPHRVVEDRGKPAPAGSFSAIANAKPLPLRAAGHEMPNAIGDSDAPLLAAAESARRAGRIAEARIAYRAASKSQTDSAEIALLRWVRLELDSGAPDAAQRVLAVHRQRFTHGRLGAEAGWQAVQVWQALGRPDRAREAARELVARYGDTPQATAARQVLNAP